MEVTMKFKSLFFMLIIFSLHTSLTGMDTSKEEYTTKELQKNLIQILGKQDTIPVEKLDRLNQKAKTKIKKLLNEIAKIGRTTIKGMEAGMVVSDIRKSIYKLLNGINNKSLKELCIDKLHNISLEKLNKLSYDIRVSLLEKYKQTITQYAVEFATDKAKLSMLISYLLKSRIPNYTGPKNFAALYKSYFSPLKEDIALTIKNTLFTQTHSYFKNTPRNLKQDFAIFLLDQYTNLVVDHPFGTTETKSFIRETMPLLLAKLLPLFDNATQQKCINTMYKECKNSKDKDQVTIQMAIAFKNYLNTIQK